MGKNNNSTYIEKLDLQNHFKKSFLISTLSQDIIIEFFIQ